MPRPANANSWRKGVFSLSLSLFPGHQASQEQLCLETSHRAVLFGIHCIGGDDCVIRSYVLVEVVIQRVQVNI